MSDTEAVSVARLIELVKERPVLWDRQEEVYKNRKLTRQAWAEICEALIDNYHDLGEQERAAIGRSIIGKWANLRDNWLRYWRKRQELLRVGSSTKSLKKYIHHDQLLFLSKVYDPEGQQEVEEIQVDVDVISDPEYESTVEFDETSQNSWNNLQYSQFPAPPLQLDQSERHLYFFHSILPMICDFDDDQVLELHAGVLEWVKRVRQRGFCNLQGYHSMDYGLQESNISSAGLSKMKSEVLTQSNCLCNSARQTLIKKEPKSDLHLTLNSSTKTKSNFKSPEIGGDFSESDVKQTVVCDKSEFVSLKDTINSLEKVIKTLDTRLFVKQDDSGNNFGSLLSQLSPKKIQSLKRKIVKEVVKEGFKKTKVGYASIESERQERLMVFNPASAKSTIVMEGEDGSGRVGPPGKSLAPSILRKSLQKLPMK